MNRITIIGMALAITSLLMGCGSAAKRFDSELKKRAAFDLKCSEDQLKITEIDSKTAGVEGCNKQATYIRMNKTWIMNTDLNKIK